jgi:GTP-binding protein
VDDFRVIRRELALYPDEQQSDATGVSVTLADKPQIVAANKIDALDDVDRLHRLQAEVRDRGLPFFAISGVTGEGVDALLEAVWPYVATRQADAAAAAPASSAPEL